MNIKNISGLALIAVLPTLVLSTNCYGQVAYVASVPGFLAPNMPERDFKQMLGVDQSKAIGPSGHCAVYELSGPVLKAALPWLAGDSSLESIFLRKAAQSTLISLSISFSSEELKKLVERYSAAWGKPQRVDGYNVWVRGKWKVVIGEVDDKSSNIQWFNISAMDEC